MKNAGLLSRNYTKIMIGDAINATLSAVGYNFRLLYSTGSGYFWFIFT